jgi:hypothetical protein
MKKILIVLLVILLSSCSKNDEETISDKSFLQIQYNGKIINVTQDNANNFGMNENCNTIFGYMSFIDERQVKFVLDFELTKNGSLKRLLFVDYTNGNHYSPSDFNSLKTFKIQNFKNINGTITFDFEGILFRQDFPNQTIELKGKIVNEKTKDLPCSFSPAEFSEILLETPVNFIGKIVYEQAGKYEYRFWSDNGFKLSIFSDKKLENLDIVNFNFSNNSNIRMELKKYIGPIMATSYPLFKEDEWISFNCSGNLNILKQNINPKRHTEGSFNITAKNNAGVIVHQITNATFKI